MHSENLPLLIPVWDVAKLLGVCRSTVWNMIAEGKLETVKIGKARRVKRASVLAVAGITAPPTPELELRAG